MLAVGTRTGIYLAGGVTDLRLGYNGLHARIRSWDRQPLNGDMYVFCNRRRDAIKLFHWDGTGMCVFSKRLEKGTFRWPSGQVKEISMSATELQLLLAGVELAGSSRRKWWQPSP